MLTYAIVRLPGRAGMSSRPISRWAHSPIGPAWCL